MTTRQKYSPCISAKLLNVTCSLLTRIPQMKPTTQRKSSDIDAVLQLCLLNGEPAHLAYFVLKMSKFQSCRSGIDNTSRTRARVATQHIRKTRYS
jgi:hypothetical protein